MFIVCDFCCCSNVCCLVLVGLLVLVVLFYYYFWVCFWGCLVWFLLDDLWFVCFVAVYLLFGLFVYLVFIDCLFSCISCFVLLRVSCGCLLLC